MFPFKTKNFSFQTALTIEELQDRVATRVRRRKPLSIHEDGQLYGAMNSNSATIEIGQSFKRNSFRPVVYFKWMKSGSKTQIQGHYRVALSVLLTTLFIPLFGLYLTIKINNVLPVLFLSIIWSMVYGTFGRWLFNKDLQWVEEEFLNLVDGHASTQQPGL